MSAYEVRIEGREEIAEGTMAFHFQEATDSNVTSVSDLKYMNS